MASNPAIERLKQKALQARTIVPTMIKEFESDLDSLIAQGPQMEAARQAAVASHMDGVAGLKGEFAGLQSAIDILSNGAPPLDGSTTSAVDTAPLSAATDSSQSEVHLIPPRQR